MDYSLLPNGYCCGATNQYPDEFFLSYSSIPFPNEGFQCVSCRFSIHPGQESICIFGTEEGKIMVCDATAPIQGREFLKTRFGSIDDSVVFDLCQIPGQPNTLISLSSRVEMWDIEAGTSVLLFGHQDSVRCASIWPENPFSLLTGSRDGSVLAWDLREQPTKRMGRKGMEDSIASVRRYQSVHDESVSITSLLHLSENYFVSSSTLASSGLRIWDSRYQVASSPLRTLFVPKRMSKESGVASMCWDRFKSSFFAACTDNAIYEYVPALNSPFPVRSLKAKNINSFFVQCSASPISDHLLCGSTHARAFVWDLQKPRRYLQDGTYLAKLGKKNDSSSAKFELDGHGKDVVECAQWSQSGQFMVTIGNEFVRVWSRWAEKSDERGYPEEIVVNHRPIKLEYAKLHSQAEQSQDSAESSQSQSFNSTPSQKSFENEPPNNNSDNSIVLMPSSSPHSRKSLGPFSALQNLPALYRLNPLEGTSWRHEKRAKKIIVIKSNLTFTPAQKIPSVQGHDNIPSMEKKTPNSRRNLMAEFQRISSGSGPRKRPPSRNDEEGKSAKRRVSRKDEVAGEEDTPSRRSPSILDYFSRTPKTAGSAKSSGSRTPKSTPTTSRSSQSQ